jgi:hypothetical protein
MHFLPWEGQAPEEGKSLLPDLQRSWMCSGVEKNENLPRL